MKKTLLSLAVSTALTVTLAGCSSSNDDTSSDQASASSGRSILNQSLGSVAFTGGNSLDLSIGFGSGAFHHPADPANIFYAVSDRGPNIKCSDAETIIGVADFCAGGTGKIFPHPDFTPSIYKLQISGEGSSMQVEVLETIALKNTAGELISGISNPLTATDTEGAFDSNGKALALDPEGLDTEAVVKLDDGTFWLGEEYGPSLVHVAADGTILERIVPTNLTGDLAGAGYPIRGLLPEAISKRKLNRGIESIAVPPDQQYLYTALQSPLANPDSSAYSTSRNVRLLKFSLTEDGSIDQLIGEYLYVLDTPQSYADKAAGTGDLKNGSYRAQKDVKVSEMHAIAEDDLIILERISTVTKLYRTGLAQADNILGSAADDLATTPSIELRRELISKSATPAVKQLVFNSLTDAPDLPSKVEGIALLDDTHLLLINDNDFGIAGAETEIVVLEATRKLLAGAAPNAARAPRMSQIGRIESGVFDEGAAEIVTFDPASQRLFVVNANDSSVDVLDMTDPANPAKIAAIDVTSADSSKVLSDANSVAVKNGLLAIAVQAADAAGNKKQGRGIVAFYGADDLALRGTVEVGALPDMLTFTPDGTKLLVANEGEPNGDYSVDPEGTISVVDLSSGAASATVTELGFSDFNAGADRADELPADVRIFGPNASVAQDLEPEYIAVSDDGQRAWVALQENNALAELDLAALKVNAIHALGFKDYSEDGMGLDASDKDDDGLNNGVNIRPWNRVLGMYQPDSIASYGAGGEHYIVTANEGDARDYDTFSEETRLEDEIAAAELVDVAGESDLGRLKITNTLGKNAAGEFETLYSYGARSFSIWNAEGERVFDSGDDFARILADLYGGDFDATNDKPRGHKKYHRSDDKGAEPEGLALGEIDGRQYAFIGLERVGGIMVYDITDPMGAQFVQYLNNRDFDAAPELGQAGDLGPEGLAFIAAADSPNGKPLLAVGNEISGSTTIYQFD